MALKKITSREERIAFLEKEIEVEKVYADDAECRLIVKTVPHVTTFGHLDYLRRKVCAEDIDIVPKEDKSFILIFIYYKENY